MTIDTRKGIAHGLDCRLIFAQLATLHGTRLLLVIQKESAMRTTHSASLREQPSGWWI